MLHLPLPRSRSVAVGKVKVGPKPQINSPGLAGEKKKVGLKSPNPVPVVLGTNPPNEGRQNGLIDHGR